MTVPGSSETGERGVMWAPSPPGGRLRRPPAAGFHLFLSQIGPRCRIRGLARPRLARYAPRIRYPRFIPQDNLAVQLHKGRAHVEAACRSTRSPASVDGRVPSGHIAAAAEAATELETIATIYTSPALVASAALARGRVELARGQAEPASCTSGAHAESGPTSTCRSLGSSLGADSESR
jgi:hypothetical protein